MPMAETKEPVLAVVVPIIGTEMAAKATTSPLIAVPSRLKVEQMLPA